MRIINSRQKSVLLYFVMWIGSSKFPNRSKKNNKDAVFFFSFQLCSISCIVRSNFLTLSGRSSLPIGTDWLYSINQSHNEIYIWYVAIGVRKVSAVATVALGYHLSIWSYGYGHQGNGLGEVALRLGRNTSHTMIHRCICFYISIEWRTYNKY